MNRILDVVIPTSWNGLSRDQVLSYADLLYPYRTKLIATDPKTGEMEVQDSEQFTTICLGLLYSFLNLPFAKWEKLPAVEVHKLLYEEKVLNFLWETYDMDKNIIGNIAGDGFKWAGPVDMSHLSFEEMQLADRAYIQYHNTKEDSALNDFIGYLYREANPKKKAGDKRTEFDPDMAEYYSKLAATVPNNIKIGVVIWYECQRELLIENYPECFVSAGSGIEHKSLADIILSIGGGLSNYDLVRKSPALLIYSDIKRIIKENERLKAKKNHES